MAMREACRPGFNLEPAQVRLNDDRAVKNNVESTVAEATGGKAAYQSLPFAGGYPERSAQCYVYGKSKGKRVPGNRGKDPLVITNRSEYPIIQNAKYRIPVHA